MTDNETATHRDTEVITPQVKSQGGLRWRRRGLSLEWGVGFYKGGKGIPNGAGSPRDGTKMWGTLGSRSAVTRVQSESP